ncbi:MAG: glycosyltransferase family 2 protein [Verrucomicrobiia bacterium]
MKLSVIIPCWNAAATLGEQLEALLCQTWPDDWEVIVTDNGSTDGSVDLVKQYQRRFDRLRLTLAGQRRGSAYARNVACRSARGEGLLFADADDRVGEAWLNAAGTALYQHPFIACRIEWRALNAHLGADAGFSHQTEGVQKLRCPPFLPHAGGGTLGVRRSVHEAVGGFDESWLRLSDTDYCIRIQRLGFALHFTPEAVVHVRCRTTSGGQYTQARLWARYYALLYKKYGADGEKMAGAWHRHFVAWKTLLRQYRSCCSASDRQKWMRGLGWQVGLLQGALMYRVPPI